MPGMKEIAETYVTPKSLDQELEAWMDEVSAFQWRKPEPVIAGKIALLVVDMTKPFLDKGRPLASVNARAILPRVKQLAEGFRRARRPVLWIVQGHHSVGHDRGKRLSDWWPSPILEGTGDVKMAAGLSPLPSEKIILKRRYSGFYQTDLELTLRNLGVSQVVICGVLTHVCPYTTAFDAFMRDFCVFYPADATASINRELHVSALRSIAGWCGYVTRTKDVLGRLLPRRAKKQPI